MTAFTIAPDGSLVDRRVWAQFAPTPAADILTMTMLHEAVLASDGCAIDVEDCIWAADSANNRLCRVAEGKGVIEQIAGPPGGDIYACALGGDDGRSLLACWAPSFDPATCGGRAELYVQTVAVPAP